MVRSAFSARCRRVLHHPCALLRAALGASLLTVAAIVATLHPPVGGAVPGLLSAGSAVAWGRGHGAVLARDGAGVDRETPVLRVTPAPRG